MIAHSPPRRPCLTIFSTMLPALSSRTTHSYAPLISPVSPPCCCQVATGSGQHWESWRRPGDPRQQLSPHPRTGFIRERLVSASKPSDSSRSPFACSTPSGSHNAPHPAPTISPSSSTTARDSNSKIAATIRPAPSASATALDAGESTWLSRLDGEFHLRRYSFDARLQANMTSTVSATTDTPPPSGQRTPFPRRPFHGQPLAGILLLSDGNATDITEAELDFTGCPRLPSRARHR
jgi:hypothetical protein